MNPLRWRKIGGGVKLWKGVFLDWILGGIADRASKHCPSGDSLCVNASDTGTVIGVGLVFVFWFIGFVALSLVWFMSRARSRQCPVCGSDVKTGLVRCGHCSHDFAAALAVPTSGELRA